MLYCPLHCQILCIKSFPSSPLFITYDVDFEEEDSPFEVIFVI